MSQVERRSRTELQVLVAQLERWYDEVPIGLSLLDSDLRYVRMNRALERMNGISREQALGRRLRDVLPAVATAVEEKMRKVLATGEPVLAGEAEIETPAHPGVKRHYVHSYYPDLSPDGEVTGVRCVVRLDGAAYLALHEDGERRRQVELELRIANSKIQALMERVEEENLELRREVAGQRIDERIIGDSAAIKATLRKIEQVADTDTTVMLLGETGTGKDVLAEAIHERSARRERTLVKVNCAALPSELIESELFGHEKGAFTGAFQRKLGRFEVADEGTLFLDEIGDLPLDLQGKLLRVLQDGEFERLGSTKTRRVDVRLITATHHDLRDAMEQARFRADLFYRLSVFPVELPPLRHRREDIPLLVWYFVTRYQRRLGKRIESIEPEVMQVLTSYDWPGNVRELQNVVERSLILSQGSSLRLDESLQGSLAPASGATGQGTLREVEEAHIRRVLDSCGWRVGGVDGAAERLGLKRTTLLSRMARLGIRKPGA